MHINKILVILFVACLLPVHQGYAFIGGPPITTYSIVIIITNLGLFAFSFFASIIFQGWYMSKNHEDIEHLEATLQSLKAKAYFLIYALPILLLSDAFGMALASLVEKLPFLNRHNNLWPLALSYFSAGLILITFIVAKIEGRLFSKTWNKVNSKELRRTIYISNIIIFAVALAIIVVNKEFII